LSSRTRFKTSNGSERRVKSASTCA
jgi:hypothetical protein